MERADSLSERRLMQRVLNTLVTAASLIACADGICVRATEGRDAHEGDLRRGRVP